MTEDAQAGPSSAGLIQRQQLAQLRENLIPSALDLLWSAASLQDGSSDEESLDLETIESWMQAKLREDRAREGLSDQRKEDIIALVLLDTLISATLPPTQPDLASVALATLSTLLSSDYSSQESMSAQTLVALAGAYDRRKRQGDAYSTGPQETAAAIRDLLETLASHPQKFRKVLQSWTSIPSIRARSEDAFALLLDGSSETTQLVPTLLSLCEEWLHLIEPEESAFIQLMRQSLQSGNAIYKGLISSTAEGKKTKAAVVHPLELGKAEGRGEEALVMRGKAEVEVLLQCLTSTCFAWSEKESLHSLFLESRLSPAAPGNERDAEYKAFYIDLLNASFHSLADSSSYEVQIWRSVLLSIIPLLLSHTITTYISDDSINAILAEVLRSVFAACPQPAADSGSTAAKVDTQESTKGLLVSALADLNLISKEQADLLSSNHIHQDETLLKQLRAQGVARGVETSTIIAREHLSDAASATQFFHGMIQEPLCAKDTGDAIIECFRTSTTVATASLDALSLVVSAFLEQPAALHTVLLFTSACELVAPLRCILTDEEVLDNLCGPGVGGDDDSGMLSRVLLFIQWLAQLSSEDGGRTVGCDPALQDFLSTTSPSASRIYTLQDLSEDEAALISRWVSELFDSDGIGDEIIRDSPPRLLIKLAPTLLHQSILAAEQGVIDVEMLKGGCSFFLQDLLSYTLPSCLTWLMRDLERIGGTASSKVDLKGEPISRSSLLVTVLSMFLLDESCPSLAVEIVRPQFEKLLDQSTMVESGALHMDPSMLEALQTRFRRDQTKELSVPVVKASIHLKHSEDSISSVERNPDIIPSVKPSTARRLRASLQPLLGKVVQMVSSQDESSRHGEEAKFLTNLTASTLLVHFMVQSRRAGRSQTADEEALADVLFALDLLSPQGRSMKCLQPRILVLSHVLRLLAHVPGVLDASFSDSDGDLKRKRVRAKVDDQDLGLGEEGDLFNIGEDQEPTSTVDVSGGIGKEGVEVNVDQGGDGMENVDAEMSDSHEDGQNTASAKTDLVEPSSSSSSRSRYEQLARLSSLAVLRAITIDPAHYSSPHSLSKPPGKNNKVGRQDLTPANGNGNGRGGGMEKNQRASIWTIRTALRILPSTLFDSQSGSDGILERGDEEEEEKKKKKKEEEGEGEEREAQLDPKRKLEKRRIQNTFEHKEGTARQVVEDVVQRIWLVVISSAYD